MTIPSSYSGQFLIHNSCLPGLVAEYPEAEISAAGRVVQSAKLGLAQMVVGCIIGLVVLAICLFLAIYWVFPAACQFIKQKVHA